MEARLPDLPDLMNDWFFGAVDADRRKDYDLSGGGVPRKAASAAPSSSRMTQEWLDEANKLVGSGSLTNHATPVESPRTLRFAAASLLTKEIPPAPELDARDHRSRSARRSRSVQTISDEILQRSSARHIRNRSEMRFTLDSATLPGVAKWPVTPFEDSEVDTLTRHRSSKPPPALGSRFSEDALEVTSVRTFRGPSSHLHSQSLIPPKIPHRRLPVLSPPRNSVNSTAPRRTLPPSTCHVDKVSTYVQCKPVIECTRAGAEEKVKQHGDVEQFNSFLSQQKSLIARVSDGEASAKTNIVFSSHTPNTSSMVAAICYARLLENMREKEKKRTKEEIFLPVINMRRAGMREHKQAAWLFNHLGIDSSALMFSDELELGVLLMGRQLNFLVVGKDILQTNEEVGSLCTILTDRYCEHAYNLLQTSKNLKRLLLAGILLDTQNLSAAKSFTNRDVEAVQLLLVGFFARFSRFVL
ncbi:hypothetical protein HPP92_001166 [Vanilla planifolia]|uniref:Uncharacterized protein n=1 Tax=Vanilla planifolia TaxID=51239 RepID=A0A835RZD6_VANPL|nr:hypothetical protein HPP92_001166 [Vanilla planifolia]